MAKKGTVQKRYGAEFKISVIMDMREHHLGYRETVRKYWNTKQGQEDMSYDQMAICGNACDRACYIHLEEKGILNKKFANKFRKRDEWVLEVK